MTISSRVAGFIACALIIPLFSPSSLRAQEAQGAKTVLVNTLIENGDFARGVASWATSADERLSAEVVPIADPPTGEGDFPAQALHLTLRTAPQQPWDLQLRQDWAMRCHKARSSL